MSARNLLHPAGSTHTGRAVKRPHPTVLNGIGGSFEDKNNDYLCPICFDLIEEAYITKCGHTFCYKCILKSLEQSKRCPKCNFVVENKDQVFPNFLLNELVSKYRNSIEQKLIKGDVLSKPDFAEFKAFVSRESERLSLQDVNFMLEILSQRKQQLETESILAQNELLKEFLLHLHRQKEEQLEDLSREVTLIGKDISYVEEAVQECKNKFPRVDLMSDSTSNSENTEKLLIDSIDGEGKPSKGENSCLDGFNVSYGQGTPNSESSSVAAKRKRMHVHFDDLVQCYFSARSKDLALGTIEKASPAGLKNFSENLNKFTRYSALRPLATLNYASDIFNNSSIVSSIEFDKDNEFFAIAGVTKRIKVYEYGSVIKDTVDIHYPCVEMLCSSKISCVSWSSYHKGVLASSDYEGTVTVWDASYTNKVKVFQEHEKRCWSVDFNHVDTKLIASGSDDSRVKLWSINMDHSVACLEAKANVCCVKFSPESCYHLAFGSADHCVHYYDLRSTKEALGVFKGHRKAVSYVKFVSGEDIVSASTDSQLKLWNINKSYCLRSFQGHINEKNFVGLATDGDYIACGSENNALYVYYKGLCKQLFSFKFDAVRSVLEKDRKEDDANEFVSAVCWRQGSNVVVAANSQGTIKILELV